MIIIGCVEILPMGCISKIILKGLRVFINFVLSNLKNISECEIRCLCVKCKKKNFHRKDVVMIHLFKKGLVKKYLYWFVHRGPYVLYKTMLERMIDSTSSSRNIQKLVDDNNNNPYRSMMIDAMRMNQNYSGEGSYNILLDEKSNADVTKFFF